MTIENIIINEKKYILYKQYQHNEKLRQEFNRMTQFFWKFDFENFYRSGFWKDTCILYSLFDEDKIVSHITVSLFAQAEKTLIQLGTVMTDENYQKQGLNRFLMERIIIDFKDVVAGIFLFANETVLDYYPKFGLIPVPEFEHFLSKKNTEYTQKHKKRKLNLENQEDLKLFERSVANSVANSQFQSKNLGLSFFYCYAYPEMGFRDSIYFIDRLNCVVVAQVNEQILHIIEIFSENEINLKDIISTFSDFLFEEIIFDFTPKQTTELQSRDYKEDDLQLFVSSELQSVFIQGELRINSLSHT